MRVTQRDEVRERRSERECRCVRERTSESVGERETSGRGEKSERENE